MTNSRTLRAHVKRNHSEIDDQVMEDHIKSRKEKPDSECPFIEPEVREPTPPADDKKDEAENKEEKAEETGKEPAPNTEDAAGDQAQ